MIEWMRRCPNPYPGRVGSRDPAGFEAEDFAPGGVAPAEDVTADFHTAIEAVWRLEAPKLVAGLMRLVRDLGAAEDLAHDALVAALEQWPREGVPRNPAAWLMATPQHRGIDLLRRRTSSRASPISSRASSTRAARRGGRRTGGRTTRSPTTCSA